MLLEVSPLAAFNHLDAKRSQKPAKNLLLCAAR
jgi:hypothetical protein